jgi:hypothetical protein
MRSQLACTKQKFAGDVLDRDLFWRMVQECLSGMPTKFDEVFCTFPPTTSGFILHRVRSALRLCLEKRWFKHEKVE